MSNFKLEAAKKKVEHARANIWKDRTKTGFSKNECSVTVIYLDNVLECIDELIKSDMGSDESEHVEPDNKKANLEWGDENLEHGSL